VVEYHGQAGMDKPGHSAGCLLEFIHLWPGLNLFPDLLDSDRTVKPCIVGGISINHTATANKALYLVHVLKHDAVGQDTLP